MMDETKITESELEKYAKEVCHKLGFKFYSQNISSDQIPTDFWWNINGKLELEYSVLNFETKQRQYFNQLSENLSSGGEICALDRNKELIQSDIIIRYNGVNKDYHICKESTDLLKTERRLDRWHQKDKSLIDNFEKTVEMFELRYPLIFKFIQAPHYWVEDHYNEPIKPLIDELPDRRLGKKSYFSKLIDKVSDYFKKENVQR